MGSRFISAVALYGPKAGPVRDLLAGVQAMIAEHVGRDFRPYSLEQIHATLIALDAARDPRTGTIVNDYFLRHTGTAVEMDLPQVMSILAERFADPLAMRIGGCRRDQPTPYLSRGVHPSERAFCVQANAFVLIGWPVAALSGDGRPLDRLRRDMNAAGVLHKYHRRESDVDDDFYLVVGHHSGAPASAVQRAVAAVRDKLAAEPLDLAIGLGEVTIVAADSHTLAPPLFTGAIPVDEATLLALMS